MKVIGDSGKNLFSGVVEIVGFGDRVYNNSFKKFAPKWARNELEARGGEWLFVCNLGWFLCWKKS